MKRITLLMVLFQLVSASLEAAERSTINLSQVIERGVRFIEKEQFQEQTGYYHQGEWPVQMRSYLMPSLVGLGRSLSRSSEEPTAFATSSIINLLSDTYALEKSLKPVRGIIKKALPSFKSYLENDLFFYYPLTTFNGMQLHVPRDLYYVPRKMMSLALVPPDADTTSVGHMALANADFILNGKPPAQYKIPQKVLSTLDQYRDIDRIPHPYNRFNGGIKNSGAFLTWLWDENALSSSFFKSMNDNPTKGYRIIFGRNDVDCVVNANVLRMLSLTKNQNQPGYASSCNTLNNAIMQTRSFDSMAKYCGLYYPNTFGAVYSISNAYKEGAICLENSKQSALQLILTHQNEDGSWTNDTGIGREDRVQTTASALGALLNYIDASDRQYVEIVQHAARFLVSQAKVRDDQVFWYGEVFFSAGPAARNTILWRSDTYTTALSVLSLAKAKAYLQNEVLP